MAYSKKEIEKFKYINDTKVYYGVNIFMDQYNTPIDNDELQALQKQAIRKENYELAQLCEEEKGKRLNDH